MSTPVTLPTNYSLPLTVQERDGLLGLLRMALGEARVQARRTHTPDFRDLVLAEQAVIRHLVERLEQLGPDERAEAPTVIAAGVEEAPAADALFIDDQGRFQMAAADLRDFLDFLRDHEVSAEVEAADAFHSGGEAYGYGRLLHLYDVESTEILYRAWKQGQGSRTAGATV